MISPLLVLLEAATAVALIGGAVAGLWAARRLPRREQLALLALAGVSLAVRWAAPAGPHDVNFRAWGAYSEGALDIERGYGFTAWARLWHVVFPDWASSERWLFDVQVLAGAGAPLALYAWLRARGVGLAVGAAALLAVSGLHARFSHTDAQQIPALTLGLVGLAAWSAHARAPSWAWAGLGVCATVAAACGRLEWAVWPAVAALVLASEDQPVRHPATWVGGVAIGALTGWHVWAIFHGDGSWVTSGYAHDAGAWLWDHPLVTEGPEHLIWLDRAYTAWPVAIATGLGVVVGPGSARWRGALAIAALALSCVVPTWTPAHGEAVAIARYQLAALPFALTLAAGGVEAMRSAIDRRTLRVAVAALAGGSALARLPVAWTPTTMSAEYAFLAETLPRLPRDCVIVTDQWVTDAGLAFPSHLVRAERPDLKVQASDAWTPDLSDCTLYYRAATCVAHAQERPDMPVRRDFCLGVGPGYRLAPVQTRALPARRWVYDVYDTSPVEVGFYRVQTGTTP